ncbi:hypothetical protein [Arthrobacter sp. B1805]|uniref:hypothetical protein n=1 Tax=Arthrobacter sp. B1805 TaxID=2058892 RepID=UPI000CE3E271|nr:hypothetical protein [Arthrobacter sp. B1805]
MLNEYVQQWSAIQTVRAAGLHHEDVFMTYFGLTGDADEFEVQGYLCGLVMLPAAQRDLLAQAINELLDSTGSTADGAHYSNEDAASLSGYGDYLRSLSLSPDAYDFTVPPAGDHSTYATSFTGAASSADTDSGSAFDTDAALSPNGADLDEVEFRRLHALHESGLLETEGMTERCFRQRCRDE